MNWKQRIDLFVAALLRTKPSGTKLRITPLEKELLKHVHVSTQRSDQS